MQATLGFKLSYLLTILTAAVLWWGPMRSSDNFFARIKKYSSSSLAFMMLNLVAAAIFLSATKSNLPPLVEGISEGAATIDEGDQNKGDFDACTPLALMEGHKQVDPVMHKESDGGSDCYDENSGCDGTNDGNNNNDDNDNDNDDDDDGGEDEDEDDDNDDIDIDLQKRSQEFIDKTIHGWIVEHRRDGLMYQP